MPVYLCQSGAGLSEPWRHGIQVYAAPFPVSVNTSTTTSGGGQTSVVLSTSASTNAPHWDSRQGTQAETQIVSQEAAPQNRSSLTQCQQQPANGIAIRRVRHAEVVLVDDVCIAFGRYWLRLRWPGEGKGFAGYIAMGLVGSDANSKPKGESAE